MLLGRASEVVVVGGGISGLSTCYFVNELAALTRQMIHLTLIEAGNRLGGKIVTDFDGMIIEGGPDSLFTLKTYALDLSKELGLSNDQVVADSESKGTYILNRGKLSKLPEGTESGMPGKLLPFLQTDLVSFSGKVRVLMDLVVPKRQETSDESIGSFIGPRIGRQFLEKIVEPLYAGIFAEMFISSVQKRSCLDSLRQSRPMEVSFEELLEQKPSRQTVTKLLDHSFLLL